jgi:hypothetical protein
MLRHRLVYVKRMDLKRFDVVDDEPIDRIADLLFPEYDVRESD